LDRADGEEAPDEELPDGELPDEELPVEGCVDELPVDELPVDELPVEALPVEALLGEVLLEGAPAAESDDPLAERERAAGCPPDGRLGRCSGSDGPRGPLLDCCREGREGEGSVDDEGLEDEGLEGDPFEPAVDEAPSPDRSSSRSAFTSNTTSVVWPTDWWTARESSRLNRLRRYWALKLFGTSSVSVVLPSPESSREVGRMGSSQF
jgi:hypothetical protein